MPSPSLRAQRVTLSFGEREVLTNATFHLTRGWAGLVGPNGSGKTTLLEVLAGLRSPDDGTVQATGAVLLCAQRVDELDPAVRHFAESTDRGALRLHRTLALDTAQLHRWPTLSPGERKRWQVGAALWAEPMALLLDEPTNHLDREARALLVDALQRFRGVGLLVSHDRALLDELTKATLRLNQGAVEHLPLTFSAARQAWAEEARGVRTAQALTRKKLERQVQSLDQASRRHEASTQSRSAGARMKSRHDRDQRGMGADFRAQTAERAHAAAQRRSAARAEQAQGALDALEVHDELGADLFLRDEPCPRPVVLSLAGEVLRRDGAPLLSHVSVRLLRGEHVHLSGPNGAGKTTLLERLLSEAALPPERVLHLPQELAPEDAEADLALLGALPRDERGRVLQVVAALGVDPEAVLATSRPSPGEARKLRLALGLGRAAWLAALDEPTNHLDLPSIERLEAALAAFPGALVLVTHDDALAARVTTRRWTVKGGTVWVE